MRSVISSGHRGGTPCGLIPICDRFVRNPPVQARLARLWTAKANVSGSEDDKINKMQEYERKW
jgi:hypothetical protein